MLLSKHTPAFFHYLCKYRFRKVYLLSYSYAYQGQVSLVRLASGLSCVGVKMVEEHLQGELLLSILSHTNSLLQMPQGD